MISNILKKGERIKISYNTLVNEVARDEGEYFSSDDVFIIIKIYFGNEAKLKWIALNKIIRIEQIC